MAKKKSQIRMLDQNLEVLSEKEEKVRKGAFYINYDNYKNCPKKVYFKNL